MSEDESVSKEEYCSVEEIDTLEYYILRKKDINESLSKLSSKRIQLLIKHIIFIIIGVGSFLFVNYYISKFFLSVNYLREEFNLSNMKMLTLIFVFLYWAVLFTLLIRRYLENKRKIYELKEELMYVNEQIEIFELDEVKYENRAEIQFKQHQKELKRYYDINIEHLKLVYPIGIILIIAGIIIIATSIFYFKDIGSQNTTQIIAGCISGILVDFIGAIFTKMYMDTIETSTKFHNKLADSNNYLFANVLATKISEEKLRDQTLSDMAKSLLTVSKTNN